MKFQPGRTLRYYSIKFRRLKGDPKKIARGFAIGIFSGITPIMPFHTVVILCTTPLFRGNLLAAFLGSIMVCNPLTYLPLYYFSWYIGSKVTPYEQSWDRIKMLMDLVFSEASMGTIIASLSSYGADTIIVLLTGGCILAVPFTVFGYFFSINFFNTLNQKNNYSTK